MSNIQKNNSEKGHGSDSDILPPDIQHKIYHDMFAAGSQWFLFSEIIKAGPERKLAMFRALKNLSQAEVAKLAKIRQADVSMAETCINNVRYGVICKIAECLGIPLSEILFEQSKVTHPMNLTPIVEKASQQKCR